MMRFMIVVYDDYYVIIYSFEFNYFRFPFRLYSVNIFK